MFQALVSVVIKPVQTNVWKQRHKTCASSLKKSNEVESKKRRYTFLSGLSL